jgi:hypothetical protein
VARQHGTNDRSRSSAVIARYGARVVSVSISRASSGSEPFVLEADRRPSDSISADRPRRIAGSVQDVAVLLIETLR